MKALKEPGDYGGIQPLMKSTMRSEGEPTQESLSAADIWWEPKRFALLLAGILFAAYPDVVLGSGTFFYRDYGLYGYPVAHYFRECLWRGEIPLWNPYNNCGIPFSAQWAPLAFYPPSVVYLLLPLPVSLGYFTFAHLYLAGIAMYFLVRRWTGSNFAAAVGGMAFGLNGVAFHSLMWPHTMATLAWMPLVVLTVERAWREGGKGVFFAALTGAMQMLTGSPEAILFTWIFVLLLASGSVGGDSLPFFRTFRRLVMVVLLVSGLCAVQLLPFLDFLSHSQRSSQFGGDVWSMPVWGVANFLVPLFRCTPAMAGVYSQDEQQFFSSYYMGIGVLCLAVLAVFRARRWRTRLLLGVISVSLLLSMGSEGYLLSWLKQISPAIGFGRYPVKFLMLVTLSVPLLAAYAARYYELNNGGKRKPWPEVATIGVLFCLIAVILWVASRHPSPNEKWSITFWNGLRSAGFLVLFAGAILLLLRNAPAKLRRAVCVLLPVLIGIDALTHVPRQNPTVPAEAYGPLPGELPVVPKLGESRAMISPQMLNILSQVATPNLVSYYRGQRRSLYGNCNLIERIPTVNGLYTTLLREQAAVHSLLYSTNNQVPGPLADFLGVCEVSSPNVLFTWSTRSSFLPMITAGQKPLFESPAATLNRLTSPDLDFGKLVFLAPEAKSFVTVTNQTNAKILARQFSPERLTFGVEASEPSLVVIAQSFYHPWKARVDGVTTPLWRANHAFQALQVPAGRHEVEVKYEDWNFYSGAVISGITLLVCFMALATSNIKSLPREYSFGELRKPALR